MLSYEINGIARKIATLVKFQTMTQSLDFEIYLNSQVTINIIKLKVIYLSKKKKKRIGPKRVNVRFRKSL